MDDIEQTATRKATQAYLSRLELDLRGAYRAGYNYLTIGFPVTVDPRESFQLKWISTPSYTPITPIEWVDKADMYSWERYELDSITDAEFMELKE